MKIKVKFWGYDNSSLNLPSTEKFYAKLAENNIILRKKDGIVIIPDDYENLTNEQYELFGDVNQLDISGGLIIDIVWIQKSNDQEYDIEIIYVLYDPFYRHEQKRKDRKALKKLKKEQKIKKL